MARMYYALQSVQLNQGGAGSLSGTPIYGVQSVGVSSSNSPTPVFQLGQQGYYSSYYAEDDQVELTITKSLDGAGFLPIGTFSTDSTSTYYRNGIQLNFWSTAGHASGGGGGASPTKRLVLDRCVVSSDSISFDADGVGTHEVTYVGPGLHTGSQSLATAEYMDPNTDSSSSLAIRNQISGVFIGGGATSRVQSISFTKNVNLETIYELGQFEAVERYSQLPVETTVDITYDVSSFGTVGTTTEPSGCSSKGQGGAGTDIEVRLCNGSRIIARNAIVTSTSYQGGGTDGSPLQKTVSYTSWDGFTHP